MSAGAPPSADAAAPARDAAPVDAVASAVVDALARRAAAQQGEVRRRLVLRIEALRGGGTASASPPAASLQAERDGRRAVLAGLSEQVDRLGRSPGARAPVASAPVPGAVRPASAFPPPRPDAVSAFQGTWLRLRAEQRLRQALAQVPAMAGPLNSSHLVNRALRAMSDLSPAYLDAFLASVDTLLWLEQAASDAAPGAMAGEPGRKPRARGARKA